MKRLSTPFPGPLPEHLIHHDVRFTLTVLVWIVCGGVITAFGGLTAGRAEGNGKRLAIGMVLTLVGVAIVGSAVLYHNSLGQDAAPNGS